MQEAIVNWLSGENSFAVHVTVFLSLILGGIGFPIPEDIPVALAGVAAWKGVVNLHSIFVTCYLGVVISDQILYLIGRMFGPRLLKAGTKSPFLPSLTEDKVQEVRDGLRRKRLFVIFVARHLFPLRSMTFISAGALKIPFIEFFLSDALAGFESVTLVMGLGYYLGRFVPPQIIGHLLHSAHYYIMGIVILSLLIILIKRFGTRKRISEQTQR